MKKGVLFLFGIFLVFFSGCQSEDSDGVKTYTQIVANNSDYEISLVSTTNSIIKIPAKTTKKVLVEELNLKNYLAAKDSNDLILNATIHAGDDSIMLSLSETTFPRVSFKIAHYEKYSWAYQIENLPNIPCEILNTTDKAVVFKGNYLGINYNPNGIEIAAGANVSDVVYKNSTDFSAQKILDNTASEKTYLSANITVSLKTREKTTLNEAGEEIKVSETYYDIVVY